MATLATDLLPTGSLDVLETETLELVVELVQLAVRDRISLQDVLDARIVFDALEARGNPLLQTLMGDIQERVGLRGRALERWERALLSLNGRSLEARGGWSPV